MIPMFLLFMILLVLFASSAFNFIAKYFYSHCKLVFGTLYPAYSSYKAIKKKDAREHSRWMMYWVCYGIFNATEFFSDILIAFWFPFYYEFKIFFILWLMSPYGNGAKVFYKTVIHPELNKREEIIDSYINKATIFSFTGINHLWRNFSAPLHNALAYGLTQVLNSDGLKEISKDIGNEIEIEEVIENGKETAKEIIEIDMDVGKENIQENVKEPVEEPIKTNTRLRPRRERKATTKQF